MDISKDKPTFAKIFSDGKILATKSDIIYKCIEH